ncbi:hypothetical protein QS257_18725 [Terrilactibacillus sp. S3-3]|nr:hypothetical protein QS257_18725 [Terrilactibacillus sp. S3-3]
MILSLIIVLILWNYFLGRVGNSLVEDVNEYTSVSTRVTTFLITIITFFHHPLGIGFSVYPYYFEKYSEIAMNGAKVIIGHFFGVSSLNFSEIFSYNFTDKNMGAKSGFMQWLLYGGIGALIYFYKSATYIKKNY